MKQRGTNGQPSRYFGIRLNAEDQERLGLIIRAGLADNISDAIRCALSIAAKAAETLAKRVRA